MKEDLKIIYRIQNDLADEAEIQAFQQRIKTDQAFAKAYADYLSDEIALTQTLEEMALENHQPIEVDYYQEKKPVVNFVLKIVAIAALFIWGFSIYQTPRERGPELLSLEGQVLTSDGSLKRGDKVPLGQVISLDSSSSLSLRYADGSLLEFSQGSQFFLADNQGRKVLRLERGRVKADISKQKKNQQFLIETPNSKSVVLGTSFVLNAEEPEARLDVLEGKVTFINRSGSQDLVKAGEYATARALAPVIALSRKKEQHAAENEEAFKRWQDFSMKLRQDRDLVAYYDYQEEDESRVLTNKCERTKERQMDGRIFKAMWLEGRFPKKKALYHSDYGYVQCGNDPHFEIQKEITVFAWIKVEKFSRDYQGIFTKGDTSWRIARHLDSNTVQFACSGIGQGPEGFYVVGKSNVNDGQWHLVTGSYDGSSLKLYIDGQLESEKEATGLVWRNAGNVEIAANEGISGRHFEGWIDEVGIFRRALSSDEVKEIYELGKPVL